VKKTIATILGYSLHGGVGLVWFVGTHGFCRTVLLSLIDAEGNGLCAGEDVIWTTLHSYAMLCYAHFISLHCIAPIHNDCPPTSEYLMGSVGSNNCVVDSVLSSMRGKTAVLMEWNGEWPQQICQTGLLEIPIEGLIGVLMEQ
jgi:hypothetical protein